MTAISVFNGLFCGAEAVVEEVLDITGYQLVTDQDIIADAAQMSGIDEGAVTKVLHGTKDRKAIGRFDQRRIISWLRLATAKRLAKGENLLFWGDVSLLPPLNIDNILRVCLISDMGERMRRAGKAGHPKEEARGLIFADDRARGKWAVAVTDRNDPWATTLYDMILPVGSTGIKQSAYLMVEQLANAVVQDSASSRTRLNDFLLASRVETGLARNGVAVKAAAEKGTVTVCFDNHEDTLRAATRNLLEFVSGFEGVANAELGVGRKYNENDLHELVPAPGLSLQRLADKHRHEEDDDYYFEPPVVLDEDSRLAETIQDELLGKGQDISVSAKNGMVSLIVNDHKLLLECLARELCDLVGAFDGVKSVEMGVGREYHQIDRITRIRHEISRGFIAGDDRTFKRFLSPRLRLGATGGTFAMCDARAASPSLEDCEPEVVMLDMPRLEDADAFRRFKEEHPGTKVLVLAGRDSEKDRETCLNLGAFAYFHKPVNMAALNDTIRAASQKNQAGSCP
jgi:CheY-like chemotaxis protein